jgi:hypothetical protein
MDYKFILILAICLILYYIYNETEKIKKENERINQKILSLNNSISKMNNVKNNQFTAYSNKVNVNNVPKYNSPMKNVQIKNIPIKNVQSNGDNIKQIVNDNIKQVVNDNIKQVVNDNIKQVVNDNILFNQKKSLQPYNIETLPNIEDDKTTISENFNTFSNKEVFSNKEEIDDGSPELAIYSNDNDNTSIGVTDVIESEYSNSENLEDVVGEIISDIEDDSSEAGSDSIDNHELNVILNSITDDNNSNDFSNDSDTKKKISNNLKMNGMADLDIGDSLHKILNDKQNLNNNDDLNVNVDIDEIVNESSNANYKLKGLRRKKLADLQAIAVNFNISLNKVDGNKLKNKTKSELCKEIVAKQN